MARTACWMTPFSAQAELPQASFAAGRPKSMQWVTPWDRHSATAWVTLSRP